MSLELELAQWPRKFRSARLSSDVIDEAKKRVLDSLACFYGAYNARQVRALREALLKNVSGEASLWGAGRGAPAELAALANGAAVRALDYNDTYLSREPCHPSDLIPSLWAACELSDAKNQGRLLLQAMILGYEVMCRLCDAKSIRLLGWDHVTYLPIASAVACSYILGLSDNQSRDAIALAVTGNNALRQTRVGTISDWKAACAAYAARSGLTAARLAKSGFTGPTDIFSGKNGFFNQVSGPFQISRKPLGKPWGIMRTHTKFFPAEHHAQSVIEAALQIRKTLFLSRNGRGIKGEGITSIVIHTFSVALQIIGSEKEKWMPTTRETADHSMPYLTAVALLDGNVTLAQYAKKRFMDSDVRSLLQKTRVKHAVRYSRRYPWDMPTKLEIELVGGQVLSAEVIKPKGYAGRPMSKSDVEEKFNRLATLLGKPARKRLINAVWKIDRMKNLKKLRSLMSTGKP